MVYFHWCLCLKTSSNDGRKVIVYRVKWHLVIIFVFLGINKNSKKKQLQTED